MTLMSGRSVQIPARAEDLVSDLKLQAQTALQAGLGVLRDSGGQIVDEFQTIGDWVAVLELKLSYHNGCI